MENSIDKYLSDWWLGANKMGIVNAIGYACPQNWMFGDFGLKIHYALYDIAITNILEVVGKKN